MLFLALLLVAFAAAAPTAVQRALSQKNVDALHLALYLENLEKELFLRGCNGFTDADYRVSDFPNTFHQQVCVIAQQEDFHM